MIAHQYTNARRNYRARVVPYRLLPVVDGDVADVTPCVRAVTPVNIFAIIQDGLRSVTNRLARKRLRARAVSRIRHVAMTDTELSSIDVGRSRVDAVQSCLTVGHAGLVSGSSAARRSNQI